MKRKKVRILEMFLQLVLIVILVFLTTTPIHAKEPTESGQGMMVQEATGSMMESKEATAAAKKTEYTLPYAGLLPDHPLYFLKAFRDRITDILIADDLKKAEFTLLEAEKRLSMAVALVDKNKPELAESTESKGQNYLARSLVSFEKAKAKGKDTQGFSAKLKSSLTKQAEVLLELSGKTGEAIKESFLTMASDTAKKRQSLQN